MFDGKPRVLVVDDEPNMVASLEIVLREERGYDVIASLSGEEALEKADLTIDLALVDLSMPGRDGISVLKELKKLNPDMEVIIMTAYSTVKSAVEAVKSGAFDYLVKPFEMEELLTCLDKALDARMKKKALEDSSACEPGGYTSSPMIIGRSSQIKKVIQLINVASRADSNVLITGESGTGKELAAQAIHAGSERRLRPFVSLNCAALPTTLLESELFGYKKGAFTGAYKSRIGLFRQADGGTLFLDEIGELPLEVQSKLLRVVETKEVFPLGGTESEPADVRIVCATNKNLEQEVKEGRFREDLFFRINVFHIHIPPLRDRREDIPYLIEHLLIRKSRQLRVPRKHLSREAFRALMEYDYPGNVRELENIIENAYLMAEGNQIEKEHLRFTGIQREETLGFATGDFSNAYQKLKQKFRLLEEKLIREAVLRYPHLSNEELAKLLGTTRRVLELRMKEYGISKKTTSR